MTLSPTSQRLLRIAHKVFFIAGILGLLWTMAIYNAYIDNLPRFPDPATGNIYPLNAHGVGVYQTLAERSHLDNVEYASWTCIIFSFVLGMIHQWREDRKTRKGR